MSDTFLIEVVAKWSDADDLMCFGGKRDCQKTEDGRHIGVFKNSDGTMAHKGMLRWMAKGGVPFYGWHMGIEGYYNCYMFASDGEKYAEIESDAVENIPVVPVDDDGVPHKYALEAAREYLKTLSRAKKLVGVQPLD